MYENVVSHFTSVSSCAKYNVLIQFDCYVIIIVVVVISMIMESATGRLLVDRSLARQSVFQHTFQMSTSFDYALYRYFRTRNLSVLPDTFIIILSCNLKPFSALGNLISATLI